MWPAVNPPIASGGIISIWPELMPSIAAVGVNSIIGASKPPIAGGGIISIIGAVIPWLFFGAWFSANGLAPAAFVLDLFANGAAGGFSADVILSIFVFWVWSYIDARRGDVGVWWLVLPAGFCVGLSLALPLYLYLRERRGEPVQSQ